MAIISLRIPDDLLTEITKRSKEMHIPRTEYIRNSLVHMNRQTELEMRRKRIMSASKRVRKNSMRINAEFDDIEHPE